MSQLPSKVIRHTPREPLATRAGQAVRQSRPTLTMTTGLAITGALVVAVAIAGPVLGSQRAATPAATTDAPQMAQTGTTSAITSASVPEWAGAEGGYFGGARYRPGAFAGYAGPEVWAAAEGGYFGGTLSSSVARGQFTTEEEAAFALAAPAYVPGPLAGYAGPEVWAVVEGGAFGGQAYVPGPPAGHGEDGWGAG